VSRIFRGPDGLEWIVEVTSPGSSNAMVLFHHPEGRTTHLDRYAWHITRGPEARSVTSRLSPKSVLAQLTDADLARLFRRSMSVSAGARKRLLRA
jgi:hypothetical protein